MNKSDFRGFKQVFIFEFLTGIKKTSFKIFIAVLCVMGFLTLPVMTIIGNIKSSDNGKDKTIEKSPIATVYVYDNSGVSVRYEELNKSEEYSEVLFVTDNSISYDDAIQNLKEDNHSNNIVVKTEYDSEDGFDITIVYAENSGIKSKDLDDFEEDFRKFYRDEMLGNLGVSEEDYKYLSKDINLSIMTMTKDGTFGEDPGRISMDDYFLMLGGLMVVFIFVNMAVGNVATSVATEKSSRVIEYLLTGTKPMALLSGKIAARLLESVITFFAVYSCHYLSQIVCLFLTAGNTVSDSASNNIIVVASIWETITFSKILVATLYFLGGLAIYAIIGAVTGASVSKLDELQEAYKFYSFVLVLCVYVDLFLVIMMLYAGGNAGIMNFCALFPLTGAFLTPALLLTGKISIVTGIIALIIMIITAAIVFVFAAAVYESMLLFQGKRLRLKDIIAIMKKQVVA
ncbi:ABC transporter permease [Butyrivibrio sp. VCB2006]|uniref:ABC transporter permease n=1 Tax=Butyrivibrio sp. VCB2006 TaxID=1280679 RepID=UPI00041C8161|nr:hypothetical protein [Butyrivibrio sp. VCB2006]